MQKITNAKAIAAFLAVLFLTACTQTPDSIASSVRMPELHDTHFIAADNATLPVRIWNSKVIPPRAVIVGLHGFNDYSNAFDEFARHMAKEHRIYTYAYDQRGFGETEQRGSWAGVDSYVQDLRDFCAAMRERFPGVPLYVMGESMGGAIAMVAFASDQPPDADGVILSAPAVWARRTMPWYQRLALFIASYTMPKASFTGKGLKVVASDNRDMLIALGKDPKVIKETEVAAMRGLTDLMDAALNSAPEFDVPALIMIGDRDQIVPNHASAKMLTKLPTAIEQQRIAIYDDGYHMLFRDLQRQTVWDDVVSWITEPQLPLPSQADAKDLTSWIRQNL